MSIFQLYRDDILTRFPGQTFTETAVDDSTRVELKGEDDIDSVSDSSGVARFEFTDSPVVLVVGMSITISGFVTNTDYNGYFMISATDGDTYFEVSSISFGSDESVGSFLVIIENQLRVSKTECYRVIRENRVGTPSEAFLRITETQKGNLTDSMEGSCIWNTTLGYMETYLGGAWRAVGDDGWVTRPKTTVQTTDNTQTTIDSLALEDGQMATILITVNGQESDGSNRGSGIVAATVYREGASAAIEGTQTVIHGEQSDSPAWDVDITVSGAEVRASVTGNASTTIDWECFFKYFLKG